MSEIEEIKKLASRLLKYAQTSCIGCPENNAANPGEDCTTQGCALARDIRKAREAGLGI